MPNDLFQFPSPLQKIENDLTRKFNIHLYLKRDDLIHPEIPGNKWRKLKYNIEAACSRHKNTILTFGGAYSNHITATAAAGKYLGFKTIGMIRGEEHLPLNNSLQFAKDCGMELRYLDREAYRNKNYELQIANYNSENIYVLPEGGANELGVKGCSEIVDEIDIPFDFICCACGTGTTLAGIATNLQPHQEAIGIAVLKHEKMEEEIYHQLASLNLTDFKIPCPSGRRENTQFKIQHYPFHGYAKTTPELIQFIKNFYEEQKVMLDYVYTGKMMYGIFDLIAKNYFPENATVIAVHTGGVVNANVFDL